MGILQTGRPAQGQAVPALRPFRPFCLGAAVRAARSHQPRGARAHPCPAGPRLQWPHVGLRRRRSTRARWCACITSSAAMTARGPRSICARWSARSNRRSRPGTTVFLDAMCARHGRSEGLALRGRARAPASRPAIAAPFPPMKRARDLEALEKLAAGSDAPNPRASVWRKEGDAASALRLKLYVLGEVLPLSASLPVFENLGLKVIAEDPSPSPSSATTAGAQEAVILDFLMERADGAAADLDQYPRAPGRRLPCRAPGPGGKRRFQPAGDRARAWPGAMSRSCARWRNSCARPRSPSARTIWSRR